MKRIRWPKEVSITLTLAPWFVIEFSIFWSCRALKSGERFLWGLPMWVYCALLATAFAVLAICRQDWEAGTIAAVFSILALLLLWVQRRKPGRHNYAFYILHSQLPRPAEHA